MRTLFAVLREGVYQDVFGADRRELLSHGDHVCTIFAAQQERVGVGGGHMGDALVAVELVFVQVDGALDVVADQHFAAERHIPVVEGRVVDHYGADLHQVQGRLDAQEPRICGVRDERGVLSRHDGPGRAAHNHDAIHVDVVCVFVRADKGDGLAHLQQRDREAVVRNQRIVHIDDVEPLRA